MELITEGQKLTLFFPKESNMVEMTCNIEKVLDDRLYLLLPKYFMRYIDFLQVGQSLTAKIFTKLGTIDFNTIVISSPMEEAFIIEIDCNALRLTTGSDLPVIQAVENIKVKHNHETLNLKTFEISTEYVKFTSNKKFLLKDNINCSLILPKDYGIISFKAEISEVDPIYDHEYTATYITMTEADRQSLLYYMYIYTENID